MLLWKVKRKDQVLSLSGQHAGLLSKVYELSIADMQIKLHRIKVQKVDSVVTDEGQ